MNTVNGVYLIEYYVRFGDPEAINALSLLDTPFTNICKQIIEEKLSKPRFKKEATVCVYVVPEGYPINPKRDQTISIGDITSSDIYYASVYDENGNIKTTTSRAVALLAKGESVAIARSRVYTDIDKITGTLFYRHDIAEGVE